MSYTYRFDGGVFRTDSLCELASKIAEDFPRIGFGDIEQIKDLLWNMSPGDYLEERVLGFTVVAR